MVILNCSVTLQFGTVNAQCRFLLATKTKALGNLNTTLDELALHAHPDMYQPRYTRGHSESVIMRIISLDHWDSTKQDEH